jgi:hypothetical protein
MKINNEHHPAQEGSPATIQSPRISTADNTKNGSTNTPQINQQTKESGETALKFAVSMASTFVYVDHMPGY